MLIIVNELLKPQIIEKLSALGEVVCFSTSNIMYEAVSGHPDLFFCPTEKQLIVAPNVPLEYLAMLEKHALNYSLGRNPVGAKYPETARYNAVCTETFFIHNLNVSDPELLRNNSGQERIHVSQGYTRCNLLALKKDAFVTSDRGIYKTLQARGLDVLFVSPWGIVLPGFGYGFFGGCCGVMGDQLFITGGLSRFPEGEKVQTFVSDLGYEIVELSQEPLFDAGSILFLEK